MSLWGKFLGWGYGYFSAGAGEHLNKRIKFSELEETNRDPKRFLTIIRNHRMKQLIYPDTYIQNDVTVVCSRCHTEGHNSKNKRCPLHPSQPKVTFEDSGEEE